VTPTANTPTSTSHNQFRARSNLTIRARDIMTTDLTVVGPDTTVRAIAELLSGEHISAVMVVDGGSVAGIVSEGDLLHRRELGTEFEGATPPGEAGETESGRIAWRKSNGRLARDVMTQSVVTLPEEAPLADIVRTLQANHVRRVPIVRGPKLVGVVSRADIMRALAARPEGSHGPTSRDDDMIRYQVIETLLAIPGTSPWATTVTVSRGIVELDGSVEEEAIRDPSRIAVEAIPDVVEVRDRRTVIQPY
jgi:CBS domain-containing protein